MTNNRSSTSTLSALLPASTTLAGQVAGDLKATLIKAGMSEADAEAWRDQIEGGRAILIGVHARGGRAAEIEAVLARGSSGRVVHTQWD